MLLIWHNFDELSTFWSSRQNLPIVSPSLRGAVVQVFQALRDSQSVHFTPTQFNKTRIEVYERPRERRSVTRRAAPPIVAWDQARDGTTTFAGDYDAVATSRDAPIVKATPFLNWCLVSDARNVEKAAINRSILSSVVCATQNYHLMLTT